MARKKVNTDLKAVDDIPLGDEPLNEASLDLDLSDDGGYVDPIFGADPPEPKRETAALFRGKADAVAEGEEKRLRDQDAQRANDRKIGLMIGPKNLEKLRAFGYDVLLVNKDHAALSPGVAHAGLIG